MSAEQWTTDEDRHATIRHDFAVEVMELEFSSQALRQQIQNSEPIWQSRIWSSLPWSPILVFVPTVVNSLGYAQVIRRTRARFQENRAVRLLSWLSDTDPALDYSFDTEQQRGDSSKEP